MENVAITKLRTVRLEKIKDVYKFVEEAMKVSGEVEITRGQFCVSGTSMMGLLAIDPSESFCVEYPANANDFDTFLQKFVC